MHYERMSCALKVGLNAAIGRGPRTALLIRAMRGVFEQLIELFLLLGREYFAELLPGVVKLQADVRRYRFHNLPAAFLAFLQELVDLLMLVGSEVQIALDTAQKVQTQAAG